MATNPYAIRPPDKAKLDEALQRLDALDEHLRKMQSGGIDVKTRMDESKARRSEILRLRNAFHQG